MHDASLGYACTHPCRTPSRNTMFADQSAFATKSEDELELTDFPEDISCPVFEDRDGNFVETMCCDYGFRSGSERMYEVFAVVYWCL